MLEPAEVCLGDPLVAGDGEQEGDVDVHAEGGELLEGDHPGLGPWHLDQDVGAVDRAAVLLCRRHRARGVVGKRRRQLERHVAVLPAGLLERRTQEIGSVPDVAVGQLLEDLLGVIDLARELADGIVVAV